MFNNSFPIVSYAREPLATFPKTQSLNHLSGMSMGFLLATSNALDVAVTSCGGSRCGVRPRLFYCRSSGTRWVIGTSIEFEISHQLSSGATVDTVTMIKLSKSAGRVQIVRSGCLNTVRFNRYHVGQRSVSTVLWPAGPHRKSTTSSYIRYLHHFSSCLLLPNMLLRSRLESGLAGPSLVVGRRLSA